MLFRLVLRLTTRGQQRPSLTSAFLGFHSNPGGARDECVESEGSGRSGRGVPGLKVGRERRSVGEGISVLVVILQGNRV